MSELSVREDHDSLTLDILGRPGLRWLWKLSTVGSLLWGLFFALVAARLPGAWPPLVLALPIVLSALALARLARPSRALRGERIAGVVVAILAGTLGFPLLLMVPVVLAKGAPGAAAAVLAYALPLCITTFGLSLLAADRCRRVTATTRGLHLQFEYSEVEVPLESITRVVEEGRRIVVERTNDGPVHFGRWLDTARRKELASRIQEAVTRRKACLTEEQPPPEALLRLRSSQTIATPGPIS